MAQALVDGGVKVLEVTLRTPVALQVHGGDREGGAARPSSVPARSAPSPMRRRHATPAAPSASARATPARSAAACRDIGLPLLPGVATASEVMQANADGYGFLKFFPATAAGGIPMLKALAGPFPDVAFCPTGGITVETAPQFLALPNVKVCGGSWLTPADAVDKKDWARITTLAKQASALRP